MELVVFFERGAKHCAVVEEGVPKPSSASSPTRRRASGDSDDDDDERGAGVGAPSPLGSHRPDFAIAAEARAAAAFVVFCCCVSIGGPPSGRVRPLHRWRQVVLNPTRVAAIGTRDRGAALRIDRPQRRRRDLAARAQPRAPRARRRARGAARRRRDGYGTARAAGRRRRRRRLGRSATRARTPLRPVALKKADTRKGTDHAFS